MRQSPAIKRLAHFHARTPAQAKKLVSEFRAVEKKLESAATVASRATASTAKQKAGQKDWVSGVRDLARGFSQITIALQDIEHGDKAAAKREAVTAQKTITRADLLGVKGDRLLGLPMSD